jgi:hypothetical protein
MAALFTTALFVGTAALALWIDVRAPRLAPLSVKVRAFFVVAMIWSFTFVPIESDTYLSLYLSVFAVVTPLLTAMWLGSLWLLRSAAEALASRY